MQNYTFSTEKTRHSYTFPTETTPPHDTFPTETTRLTTLFTPKHRTSRHFFHRNNPASRHFSHRKLPSAARPGYPRGGTRRARGTRRGAEDCNPSPSKHTPAPFAPHPHASKPNRHPRPPAPPASLPRASKPVIKAGPLKATSSVPLRVLCASVSTGHQSRATDSSLLRVLKNHDYFRLTLGFKKFFVTSQYVAQPLDI